MSTSKNRKIRKTILDPPERHSFRSAEGCAMSKPVLRHAAFAIGTLAFESRMITWRDPVPDPEQVMASCAQNGSWTMQNHCAWRPMPFVNYSTPPPPLFCHCSGFVSLGCTLLEPAMRPGSGTALHPRPQACRLQHGGASKAFWPGMWQTGSTFIIMFCRVFFCKQPAPIVPLRSNHPVHGVEAFA